MRFFPAALAALVLLSAPAWGQWPPVNSPIGPGKEAIKLRQFSPQDYGADITGVADATAAIQAAQAACAAAGGGEIRIDGQRLRHNTTITVAEACPIVGTHTPHSRTGPSNNDFSGLTSTIINGPAANLGLARNAKLRGVLVLASTVGAPPASFQQGAALVAGMANRGVTIAGNGTVLEDVQILGFDTGIYSQDYSQIVVRNAKIDARNCVHVEVSHDANDLSGVHCWPYLTANAAWTSVQQTSTTAANNAGAVRFTVPSTANFAAGNRLFIVGTVAGAGATVCDGALIPDGTTIDCPTMQYAPTATGAVTTGSNVLVLSAANKSISAGMTIADTTTGGNIPGGATVSFVANGGQYVYMSAAATGTGAADALSFTRSGATSVFVILNNDFREGTAFYVQEADLFNCRGCTEYGYRIGLDLVDSITGNYTAMGLDDISTIADAEGIGVRFRGASQRNRVIASYIDTRQGVISDSTAGASGVNTVEASLSGAPSLAQVLVKDGALDMSSSSQTAPGAALPILVLDTAEMGRFCGSFPSTRFAWQNVAAYKLLNVCPGTKHYDGVAFKESWQISTNGLLATGTTAYAGRGTGTNATETNIPFLILTTPMTMSDLGCRNSVAAGGAASHTITARASFIDTALVCTMTGTGRGCNKTDALATFSPGGVVTFSLVSSAGAVGAALQCSAIAASP